MKKCFVDWSPSCATRFIEDFEGRRLVAYRCSAGVWTIGVGHTEGVHEGMTCTDERADAWLKEDIRSTQLRLAEFVKVPVTQGQFIALVSLAFNVGVSYVANCCPRLMCALNNGRIDEAADEFLDIDKAGGCVLPGLSRRRRAESDLFRSQE